MDHRRDIDGLRAVAVLPVILFHAGFSSLSGGFAGVDVFFVISGFLITKILTDDLNRHDFSILRFYERRARRILPALLLVILCSLPLAWLVLLPPDLIAFGKSVLATLLFSSNIFFWQQSGYFDQAAELKPLLHTWSLAVEEQFYLVFPFFLRFIWHHNRKRMLLYLALAAGASLLLSEYGWRNYPNANFYLALTRAWELLTGAICALLTPPHRLLDSSRRNTLSATGLFLILYSILFFDETTPFPSLYTLLPVTGTALILLFAPGDTYVARLLSSAPFVGVGLISYSAYLWHQPLFAFARHASPSEPSQTLMGLLALASLILAALTWRLIEQPFRGQNAASLRTFTASTATALVILVSAALVFISSSVLDRVWPGLRAEDRHQDARYRLVVEATDYDMYQHMHRKECSIWVRDPTEIDLSLLESCYRSQGPATVILGDSHAMNLYNIISKSKFDGFLLGISQGGCRAHDSEKVCHYHSFDEFVRTHKEKIKTVLYHQSGSYFIKDDAGKVNSNRAFSGKFGGFHDENVDLVRQYLTSLHERHAVRVIWVGPFIEYRYKPLKRFLERRDSFINSNSLALFRSLDPFIEERMGGQNLFSYVRFSRIFDVPQDAFSSNCFIYRDEDHFSRCGEDLLAKSDSIGLIFN